MVGSLLLSRGREARIAANDAMVAMMLAARIADDTLAPSPPCDMVGDLFPQLSASRRVNREVKDARELVARGESLIAPMAIPYVLSLHHRTLGDALAALKADGRAITDLRKPAGSSGSEDPSEEAIEPVLVDVDPYDVGLAAVHSAFTRASGANAEAREVFPKAELNAFAFARQLRNRLMHQGGIAGPSLKEQWKAAKGTASRDGTYPDDGQALWISRAKRPFPLFSTGSNYVLEAGELFATLACCKQLEDAAERELTRVLSLERLADLVIEQYALRNPQRINMKRRLRERLSGFRQSEYPRLDRLTPDVIMEAYARRA